MNAQQQKAITADKHNATSAQAAGLNGLHFSVAYYREYMHTERLAEDIKLMQEAGINTVRIGESTWSTYEKQDGVFDFSPLTTVLDAMYKAHIQVIVGTPTYAVPAWLVRKYPEIMVTTPEGRKRYGPRQLMDITHPAFLFHAERLIRNMMKVSAAHPAVIGFQLDNETKYYESCSSNVQQGFVQAIKAEYDGNLERLNDDWGLDYWSNRIDSWEDFPDVVNTINGSLGCAFQRYQRSLVTKFLAWQRALVEEYKRPEQFITHNLDFEWRQYSFGMQPSVDHFGVSQILDIAGVDIYHPGQHELTGHEIGYGGDWTYALKDQPYFVLETEAQGFKNWTPLPGQLYLQGLLHLAHGAHMVSYWHWHSLHNSYETYWKGLLSHDMTPNPVYYEAARLGKDLAQLSPVLNGFNKQPYTKVCLVVSNEALSAVDYFPFEGQQFVRTAHHQYNDVVRRYYDALHDENIQVDIRDAADEKVFSDYKLIVVPMLYVASDEFLRKLQDYIRKGGNVLASFRTGVCNEHVQVRATSQPGMLNEVLDAHYQLIAQPQVYAGQQPQVCFAPELNLDANGLVDDLKATDLEISEFMELLEGHASGCQPELTTFTSEDSQVWATYSDPAYKRYAAIVFNEQGKAHLGSLCYIGCHVTTKVIRKVLRLIMQQRKLQLKTSANVWPCLTYKAKNKRGQELCFVFNVSDKPISCTLPDDLQDVLTGKDWSKTVTLEPWAAHVCYVRNTK